MCKGSSRPLAGGGSGWATLRWLSMADPGWLSMGDPAGSAWPTLGGSVSPTPVAQYRVTADRRRSPAGCSRSPRPLPRCGHAAPPGRDPRAGPRAGAGAGAPHSAGASASPCCGPAPGSGRSGGPQRGPRPGCSARAGPAIRIPSAAPRGHTCDRRPAPWPAGGRVALISPAGPVVHRLWVFYAERTGQESAPSQRGLALPI